MVRISEEGYVERNVSTRKNPKARATWRNWWLIKHKGNIHDKGGYLPLRNGIQFQEKYVGKKIRLKVEVLEEAKKRK